MQALDADQHLERVLRGGHAFLTWKYYIRTIALSHYTDARGYSPIYVGRQEYINYGGYGWGFRYGKQYCNDKRNLSSSQYILPWNKVIFTVIYQKVKEQN